MITKTYRESKYTPVIKNIIDEFGHASNNDILERIRLTYPDVSATTVHRATARLKEQGKITEAPHDSHGAMRYDSNVLPHDHFACKHCDNLRDVDLSAEIMPKIQEVVGDCEVSGRFVIYGNCSHCVKEKKSIQ